MNIIGLIASRNFIAVNKTLIKAIGLEEAVILGELASEYSYWQEQGRLDDSGYFFSTVDNIEDNTGLKERRQKTAIDSLVKAGVLDVKLKGLPAKRHFKISAEQLASIMGINNSDSSGTSSDNLQELGEPKRGSNKNKQEESNKKK